MVMKIIFPCLGCFFLITYYLYSIFPYFVENGWAYYFFDSIIKAFTGIAALITAWGVYWKWNDEKRRKIYEERIQKVYAPLIKVLVYQESYRNILKNFISGDIDRENYPIFGDSKYEMYYKLDDEKKKTFDYICETKETIYMSRDKFLTAFEDADLGLARPSLLTLIARYKFLLPYKNDQWEELLADYPDINSTVKTQERTKMIQDSKIYIKFKIIDGEIKKVEKSLCEEIVNGYNDSLGRLGLDKQKIDLDAIDFIKNE